MPNIIATCIVLHNLCIVNNEGIEEYWIVEAKNKLAKRNTEGKLRECNEMRGGKTRIVEMKIKIMTIVIQLLLA